MLKIIASLAYDCISAKSAKGANLDFEFRKSTRQEAAINQPVIKQSITHR